MPINVNGNLYYTKAQYQEAAAVSAAEYALRRGYPLKKQGSYYILDGHDSMVFAPDGTWHWNSKGLYGRALAFAIHYERLSFPQAVNTILELDLVCDKAASEAKKNTISVEFPPEAPSYSRLFGYLSIYRKIDSTILRQLVKRKLLYVGVTKTTAGAEHQNAVFVYYDPQGRPIGGALRGLASGSSFKGALERSNKDYGWFFEGSGKQHKNNTTVYVFEAAIDAISQLSLVRLERQSAADDAIDRISLEGPSHTPLLNYLSRYPQTTRVVLMVDNDDAGVKITQRIKSKLSVAYPQIVVDVQKPPSGKDWNDALRAKVKQAKEEK